jgi:hypothetical protein
MRVPDKIPGGQAAGKDIEKYDARELAKGTLHELEHTTSFLVAVEIAADHLEEDSRYYTHLERTERRYTTVLSPGVGRKTRRTLKKKPSKRKINQFIRDQFRDIYDR